MGAECPEKIKKNKRESSHNFIISKDTCSNVGYAKKITSMSQW